MADARLLRVTHGGNISWNNEAATDDRMCQMLFQQAQKYGHSPVRMRKLSEFARCQKLLRIQSNYSGKNSCLWSELKRRTVGLFAVAAPSYSSKDADWS